MPSTTTVQAQPASAIAVTQPSRRLSPHAIRAKTIRLASEASNITPVPPIVTTRRG